MLCNPCNPFLKLLLGVAGSLVAFKQAIHNLRLGFFLVLVDCFYFELYSVYFAVESFYISLESQ